MTKLNLPLILFFLIGLAAAPAAQAAPPSDAAELSALIEQVKADPANSSARLLLQQAVQGRLLTQQEETRRKRAEVLAQALRVSGQAGGTAQTNRELALALNAIAPAAVESIAQSPTPKPEQAVAVEPLPVVGTVEPAREIAQVQPKPGGAFGMPDERGTLLDAVRDTHAPAVTPPARPSRTFPISPLAALLLACALAVAVYRFRRMTKIFFAFLLSLCAFTLASAAAPADITYQGSLTDNGVSVNATKTMSFRLTNQDGTVEYWSSGAKNVVVTNGVFHVKLTPTGVAWHDIAPYIEVTIAGQLLLPRDPVLTTPYSLVANRVADSGITASQIASGQILDAHIAANAGIALSKLAKDPSAPGTINTSTNPIHWTQLKGVPDLVLTGGVGPKGDTGPAGPTALIGDVTASAMQIIVLVFSLLMMAALYAFVNFTRAGTAMRAVSLDHDTSRLMGIDVNRVITIVFLIGPALGAAAGMMVALYYGSFDFTLGMSFGLKAFIAAILGGIGNIPGAMLGGMILGIVESLGAGYWSPQWKDVLAYVLLALILIVRPTGLLGERVAEKL